MAFRAVKDNSSSVIIAIGKDEDQGGQDYNGVGTWCNFTFEGDFSPSSALIQAAETAGYEGSLLVEDNGSIRLMTSEEIPGE